MAPGIQKRMTAHQIVLKDLNPFLTCTLCRGYLIDATSLVDCMHVFCRACILRYFENFKLGCPTCNVTYKKKSNSCFRPDPIIQSLVYKLVPGLYSKEVQRREDFYRSTGVRASSSCSEDSVLGDLNEEHDEWVLSTCGDPHQYLSPDDAISLSLEYYKPHLDTTQNSPSDTKSTNYQDSTKQSDEKSSDLNNSANLSAEKTHSCDSNNINVNVGNENNDIKLDDKQIVFDVVKVQQGNFDEFLDTKKGDRRYLQCPAAVTMSLLQKFLRMKHALSAEHRVDIIHLGEILPQHFSLMDVAYTFEWKRTKPMRFFYRIFIPAKIQPIKIINTALMGGKQLQVVPAKSNNITQQSSIQRIETTKDSLLSVDTDSQNYKNKERLMTNLQLQSKLKPHHEKNGKEVKFKTAKEEADCIFEYQEPDKEEIREFAERRDREWALQKRLDEEKEKHRTSKKRKKNKHSKNNLLYKKRKLHAEITSSESLQKEESLKLKVKLTPHNGYKHKHHKSSQQHPIDQIKTPELSSKEKLLQMRQVRHKHISSEDKSKNVPPPPQNVSPPHFEQPKPAVEIVETPPPPPPHPPPSEPADASSKTVEQPQLPPATEAPSAKTLRSDFAAKTSATKEILMQKYPTVQLERNEQTERHAQKTFLKTFQSYTESFAQTDKNTNALKNRQTAQNCVVGKTQITKSLEQKIANLHQQCTTIEPRRDAAKIEKKFHFPIEKRHALNSPYPTGFTVSKIEAGARRKPDGENTIQDKRPSLEITLINPPVPDPPKHEFKPTAAKRPPPPTIPLERIKKSMNNRVSAISIIQKEKCDNTGALDLSKPNRGGGGGVEVIAKPPDVAPSKLLNGLNVPPERVRTPDGNIQLSNLQMLSKVATEHPNINKSPGLSLNKRLAMPSLQTLKIPNPQQANPKSNLAKLPKLNEISKTQFRLPNPQMRNMRPNQNQSVRNIPNPSLLVRQQNQNRLNSLSCAQSSSAMVVELKDAVKPPPESTNGQSQAKCVSDEKSQNKLATEKTS